MKIGKIFFVLLFLGCSSSVVAYETQTHAYITYHAYKASVIGATGPDGQALRLRMGLDRLETDRPFTPYWLGMRSLRATTTTCLMALRRNLSSALLGLMSGRR